MKKLVWSKNECIFCGGCVAVCPPGNVLVLYEENLEMKHQNCTRCGKCVKACPMGALELSEEAKPPAGG
ncbi:MAG: 4Fe-4S dicluster domain-containing protein [Candidatus Thermoplasmatota archaeon]|nr:4Fe-4S dicluster domain-containing protein [Candidatus Thermoplasmatota archaeon]